MAQSNQYLSGLRLLPAKGPLFAIQHWSVVVGHVLFGAVAGGTYELLEDQIFETDITRRGT